MELMKKGFDIKARHVQALMVFLGMTSVYSMRVNLSVGIVAMTNASSANIQYPEINWTSPQKGAILSSFFWGYIFPQMPAGHLVRFIGPRLLLGGALLSCGILTLAIPFIAMNFNWTVMCGLRVLQGLCQGVVYTSIYSHVSNWAPPLERNRILSFILGGVLFGTMVTMFFAGILAASPGGWPSIFYVTGTLAIIWALIWLYIGADNPTKHRSISELEKQFIISSLVNNSSNAREFKVPVKEILTSMPFYSLALVHFGQNWGFYTLLTLAPSYMNSVLGFDITSNGYFSAMPYLIQWITLIAFSVIADYVIKNNLCTIGVSRKIWNSLAHWGGALLLVMLSQVSDNIVLAVILLSSSIAFNAGSYTGYQANHIDLSPNFASVLMGITNCFSNFASFLAPLIGGLINKNEKDPEEWKKVFYLSALIFFVGNLIFVIFGSGDVQTWNVPIKKETVSVENGSTSEKAITGSTGEEITL
uniref:Putative inorganic phosphate cotransporter n=1 Tax=Clastoptera arizonana TaxID=38151 RepID=A0A1B6DF26_9HEMI